MRDAWCKQQQQQACVMVDLEVGGVNMHGVGDSSSGLWVVGGMHDGRSRGGGICSSMHVCGVSGRGCV